MSGVSVAAPTFLPIAATPEPLRFAGLPGLPAAAHLLLHGLSRVSYRSAWADPLLL